MFLRWTLWMLKLFWIVAAAIWIVLDQQPHKRNETKTNLETASCNVDNPEPCVTELVSISNNHLPTLDNQIRSTFLRKSPVIVIATDISHIENVLNKRSQLYWGIVNNGETEFHCRLSGFPAIQYSMECSMELHSTSGLCRFIEWRSNTLTDTATHTGSCYACSTFWRETLAEPIFGTACIQFWMEFGPVPRFNYR